jgi:hypothetical protein
MRHRFGAAGGAEHNGSKSAHIHFYNNNIYNIYIIVLCIKLLHCSPWRIDEVGVMSKVQKKKKKKKTSCEFQSTVPRPAHPPERLADDRLRVARGPEPRCALIRGLRGQDPHGDVAVRRARQRAAQECREQPREAGAPGDPRREQVRGGQPQRSGDAVLGWRRLRAGRGGAPGVWVRW